MTSSFGARLRSYRERRGIGLDAIAQSTKLRVGVLEALERDDTSQWPSGIFRRAFVRAYATAVGLDPEATLDEFLQLFPDSPDSNDERRASVGEETRASTARLLPSDVPSEPLRLMLADAPPLHRRAPRVRWPRMAAAVADLVVVSAIASAAFAVVGAFWAPFALATACYYFGGVLIVGTSPAAYLFGRRRGTLAAGQHVVAPELLSEPSGAEADHLTRFRTRRYPRAV